MIISNLDFQENIAESSKVLGGVGAFANLYKLLNDSFTVNNQLVSDVKINTLATANGLLAANIFDDISVSAGAGFVNGQSVLIVTATTPNSNS